MTASSPSEQFWEELYSRAPAPSRPPGPNTVLRDLIDEYRLLPGRALDLGAGSGGDAVWLASRGWSVTTVDASTTAAGRTRELADAHGVAGRVRATAADLARYVPAQTFDLVYACYFHSPIEIDRAAILRRSANLMGVGGTLIVIDHASTAPWSWASPDTDYPTPQQTYTLIGLDRDWDAQLATTRDRTAEGPEGQSATVTDNIILARRIHEPPFSARAEQETAQRLRGGSLRDLDFLGPAH